MSELKALEAELKRLQEENKALKNKASVPIRFKVSGKGALSVYGLGRFPVTLYKSQWNRLLTVMDDLKKFIADNEKNLKEKE